MTASGIGGSFRGLEPLAKLDDLLPVAAIAGELLAEGRLRQLPQGALRRFAGHVLARNPFSPALAAIGETTAHQHVLARIAHRRSVPDAFSQGNVYSISAQFDDPHAEKSILVWCFGFRASDWVASLFLIRFSTPQLQFVRGIGRFAGRWDR